MIGHAAAGRTTPRKPISDVTPPADRRRLIYGGHVPSMARALRLQTGWPMRQMIVAITGGKPWPTPALAGDNPARLGQKCWMWPRMGAPGVERDPAAAGSQVNEDRARGRAEGCGRENTCRKSCPGSGLLGAGAGVIRGCEALRRCADIHAEGPKNQPHQFTGSARCKCPGRSRSGGPIKFPQTGDQS